MKKRGQVAIFALLGLVLLIIVSFMLMLVNTVSTAELQQQAQDAVQEYLESGPINYYVNLCLEQAVQESLIEMGRQGGTFFDSQQGPYVLGDEAKTHIPYNESDEEFNVSYGILRPYNSPPQLHFPELCPGISQNPPDYPIQNTYLTQYTRSNYISNCYDSTLEKTGGGYVGQNVFPRLCFSGSPNTQSINIPGAGLFMGCAGRLVPSVYQNENLSTEHLLAQRILNKTIECIDFDIFQEIDGHNVSFLENSQRSAQVIYEVESFTSTIVLPFRVQLRGHVPVITSYSFSYGSNVRLAEIQRYIYELLREETMNPNFDIIKDYNNIIVQRTGNLFLDGFELEIINFTDTSKEYKWDRLLKLTDTKSLIFGQNYTYYTAIQNRNPVLDYINPSAHPELNIIVFENDTIVITPYGVDPDNRLLEYDYSRWNENETNTINLASPCNYPFSTVDEIKECMTTTSSSSKFWTTSELFLQTLQAANYTVTIQDIGYHELRVIVRDESGRADFQDVKILVIDLPKLNLEVRNYHDYFPDEFSVENPIVFDADKTTMPVVVDGIIKDFEWTLKRGTDIIKTYNTNTLSLTIPSPFNILTIRNDIIKTLGMHTMTLKATFEPFFDNVDDKEVTKSYDFIINQCLPHRNPSSPAYPYNTVDPFLSNSTCCNDGFETNDGTYVCFNEVSYGTSEKLFERVTELITVNEAGIRANVKDFNVAPTVLEPGDDIPRVQSNNVFKLDFRRSCDGTRGNVCGGDITYELKSVEDCSYFFDQKYQCSGLTEEFSYDELSCTNFDHTQVFDAENRQIINGVYTTYYVDHLGIPKAEVVALCNEDPAPSLRAENGYNISGGHLLCVGAACDGTGFCKDTRYSECSCIPEKTECQNPNNSSWTGTTCKYGCDTYDSCRYENQIPMPCTEEEYIENGDYCFNETTKYCYGDLECTFDVNFVAPTDFCFLAGLKTYDFRTIADFPYYEVVEICQHFEDNECTSTGDCGNIIETEKPVMGSYECTPKGWMLSI